MEVFPLPNKKQPLSCIFWETPQNPPFQFQFPNLVSFPLGLTHNFGLLTLNAPRLSLLKMIFVN